MTQTEFIDMLLPEAKRAYRAHGLWPSINIAQAALESGWGKFAPGYNLYGIMWFDGCGYDPQTVMTSDGERVLKKYNSYAESMADHTLLMTIPLYSAVLKSKDYKEAAYALQTAGYAGATDDYAPALINVVEGSNLQAYDDVVRPYAYNEVDKAIAYLVSKGEIADVERAKQSMSFWIGINYIYIKWANSLRKTED